MKSFSREQIVKFGVLLLFAIILARLFQIQVLNVSRYRAQAREQHWSENIIPAKRGAIYTSDGYPVVMSLTNYYPHIETSQFKNEKQYEKFLSPYYSLEQIQMMGPINFDVPEVRLSLPVSWEIKKTWEAASDAPKFEEVYSRYYPEKTLLAHTLGFVGKNKSGEEVGYYGLEQFYDGYLKGQDGWALTEKSALGDPILWGGSEKFKPEDGSDLKLTIDRNIQFMVEKHLKDGMERYHPKSGVAIVLNPSDGSILAMAKYPLYDANAKNLNLDDVRNDVISATYEPGSVVKALTMSSAIDMGKVSPDTTYNDTGPREFSGYKVDNWDGKHHGVISMVRILQLSNNLGIAWVGQQVGSENLMKYFHTFGLGKPTGIDLEGEESGIMYNSFPLKDIELANASFGQGISVTPLQIVSAFGAIANKGVLMKPRLVSEIKTREKDVVVQPEITDRPISEKSSETMVDMLTQAVSGGEAKYFVSKKYLIAGKTGTAQIPVKGGYDAYRTNATFVGFFPTYRNFVMLVKLEEPTSPSGYAAETAVPLWMRMAEDIADYYGLNPDRPQQDPAAKPQ